MVKQLKSNKPEKNKILVHKNILLIIASILVPVISNVSSHLYYYIIHFNIAHNKGISPYSSTMSFIGNAIFFISLLAGFILLLFLKTKWKYKIIILIAYLIFFTIFLFWLGLLIACSFGDCL